MKVKCDLWWDAEKKEYVSANNPTYKISEISREDLEALLRMIKGAGLEERRVFNGLKGQIESLLKE